jgi:osmotically-inducible protein OsmY
MNTLTHAFPIPAAARTPRVPAAPPATNDDDRLRDAVLARLRREDGWEAATSNVFVDAGTVVLQGLVRSGIARQAGRRIAAGVPGVSRVWDARVLPRG